MSEVKFDMNPARHARKTVFLRSVLEITRALKKRKTYASHCSRSSNIVIKLFCLVESFYCFSHSLSLSIEELALCIDFIIFQFQAKNYIKSTVALSPKLAL